jgi:hypothetical protein
MALQYGPVLELPDRKQITLCEAITAVIYGKARTARQINDERLSEVAVFDSSEVTPAKQESTTISLLLERLHEAAYAGRVKLRGIREGNDFEHGHEDIENLYFSVPRVIDWARDMTGQPGEGADWHFVHIDRDQYVSLLKDLGISVQPRMDSDVQDSRKTFIKTYHHSDGRTEAHQW